MVSVDLWNLEAEGEQENLCEDGIYSSGLSCTCLTYQPHPQLAPPAGSLMTLPPSPQLSAEAEEHQLQP